MTYYPVYIVRDSIRWRKTDKA